jgi:hypothetical protein
VENSHRHKSHGYYTIFASVCQYKICKQNPYSGILQQKLIISTVFVAFVIDCASDNGFYCYIRNRKNDREYYRRDKNSAAGDILYLSGSKSGFAKLSEWAN